MRAIYPALALLMIIPNIICGQVKTINCYKTEQYGIAIEKCVYQMDNGASMHFDNGDIYICKIETTPEYGVKCIITYNNSGDIEIKSNKTITPLIEEIPDNNGHMKKLTYTNEAWNLYNSSVLKIVAKQRIKITVIKKL